MYKRPAYGHRLIANRVTGPGILSFTTHEDVQIHVHASNEIPNSIEGDIKENIFYGTDKEIILKITEIVNDHSVKDVAINYRKCRFSWELDNQNFESIYNYYSHSTCSVECTMNIQKQFCNCTHHLMPRRKSMIRQNLNLFFFKLRKKLEIFYFLFIFRQQ